MCFDEPDLYCDFGVVIYVYTYDTILQNHVGKKEKLVL
jgi:hypothetical protein